MEFDPFRIPLLVAGAATLLVGIAALFAPPVHRIRHCLAAVLVLKGAALTTGAFAWGTSPEVAGWMLRAQPYLLLPLAVLALAMVVQPLGTSRILGTRQGLTAVGLVAGGLAFAYGLDHSLVYSLERGDAAQGIATAGSGWVYTAYGPLVVLIALPGLAFSLLGFRFAQQAVKSSGPEKNALRWYALAFIVNGVFDGGLATAYLIHDPSINSINGLGWILAILRASALLPAGLALGLLLGTELGKPMPSRRNVLIPSIVVLGAWFSGPMPVILGGPDYGATWPTAMAMGFARSAVAVLIGIALWSLHVQARHDVRAYEPVPSATAKRV